MQTSISYFGEAVEGADHQLCS